MGNGIVAPIALGIRRVTGKDAHEGAWGKLIQGGERDARITETPENMEFIIGWWSPIKQLMRCIVPTTAARPDVGQKICRGKGIRPKMGREVGMEE